MQDVMAEWAAMAARAVPVAPAVARMRPHGRVLNSGQFWSISSVHRQGNAHAVACGAVCRLHVQTATERPGLCKKTLAISENMPEELARTHLKRWLVHGALMTLADSATPRSHHRDLDARSDARCTAGLEGPALDARLLELEAELREQNLL